MDVPVFICLTCNAEVEVVCLLWSTTMISKIQRFLLIISMACFLFSCSPQVTDWEEIPVMKGGKEFSAPARTDVKAYTYIVTVTPEEAEIFYKEKMPPLGWDLFEEQTQEIFGDQSKTLYYGKGPQTLTIDIFTKDKQTYISFVLYE